MSTDVGRSDRLCVIKLGVGGSRELLMTPPNL